MRHVDLQLSLAGRRAAQIYPLLCDFERYPTYTDQVQSVQVVAGGDDHTVSTWEVSFNRGLLRWTEEDRFDRTRHVIDFRQLQGDVDAFHGRWALHDDEHGCVVQFTADLDLGLPGLEGMLGPIAERALRDNVSAIIHGLLRVSGAG